MVLVRQQVRRLAVDGDGSLVCRRWTVVIAEVEGNSRGTGVQWWARVSARSFKGIIAARLSTEQN